MQLCIDLLPGALVVALGTGCTEAIAVRVFVATRARRELHPNVLRRLSVALAARYRCMRSAKWVPRRAMVEAVEGDDIPSCFAMALGAGRRKPPAVRVLMAGSARRRKPNVRASLVALVARNALVRVVERPAGLRVVERIGTTAWPTHNTCPRAKVLRMTGLARLTAVLPPMKSLASGNPRPKNAVAMKAARRRYLPSRRMAFGAMLITLQGRVRARQWAWRQELCRNHGRVRTARKSAQQYTPETPSCHGTAPSDREKTHQYPNFRATPT